MFNWTVLDSRIGDATSQRLHVSLMIWVALHGSPPAPAWLMSPGVGVPGVEVHGESGNHVGGSTSWVQPWYFSDVYIARHARMIKALASHLRSLPPTVSGNFDIILDHFSRICQPHPHRKRAARHHPLGFHADRVLIGASNPML